MKQLEWRGDECEPETETVVAIATLARVNLAGRWLDSLDAESSDLEAVGGAFLDRERLGKVDEDSRFADSLVIIDYVEVPEEHRGLHVSHGLVWGIAHIFRSDIVALQLPALRAHAENRDATSSARTRHSTKSSHDHPEPNFGDDLRSA